MTSEIVLMNKDAIAMAADSAVTLTMGRERNKIFTSAHKIFTLSKYHPVGIMIYNDAHFMGVPWETIIKDYRNKLGEEPFDTLNEYADHFIGYLKKKPYCYDLLAELIYAENKIHDYFIRISEEIVEELKLDLENEENITEDFIADLSEEISSRIINDLYDTWKNSKFIKSIPNNHNKYLKDNYSDLIEIAKKEIFEQIKINEDSWNKLDSIARFLFTRFPTDFIHSLTSGVVITGFGNNEMFPSVKSFLVDGTLNDHLMYEIDNDLKIDLGRKSLILPFAQSEMVHSFMQGVIPEYQYLIDKSLYLLMEKFQEVFINSCSDNKFSKEDKMLIKSKLKKSTNELVNEYIDRLDDYRQEEYIDKVTKIVSHLPKIELALMAKTFINLTSFKRKVSMESETVSEPIDVAIISKGDGFIWIERKHYFKPELNQQFFDNYYKKIGD